MRIFNVVRSEFLISHLGLSSRRLYHLSYSSPRLDLSSYQLPAFNRSPFSIYSLSSSLKSLNLQSSPLLRSLRSSLRRFGLAHLTLSQHSIVSPSKSLTGACILGNLLGIFLINLQSNFDGDALNFEINGVMLILSWQTSVIALRMKARRLLQNNISSPIPIELRTVPLLQTLDFSNNQFSDWFMWSILGGPLFKLIAVDWLKVDKSFDDIALHPRNLVQQVEQSVQKLTITFEELARVQNHPPEKSAAEQKWNSSLK
uniref:Uncharacterized protein n=1 Tax=Cucumis melo TaxID=3656 RepID=A0A9I9EBF2_CUCME